MKTKYNTSILVASLAFIGWSNAIHAQTIAAGGWHSLSICADSTVKAFGENASGQLGDGTTSDKSTPVTVSGLSGIISISVGGDQLEAHSMALKSNGTVWTWGSNIYGGLGNGTTNPTITPLQVVSLSDITAIAAGGWHSVALKNDGTVWAWGWNTDGQIGDGTTVDKLTPTQVPGLSGILKISAGTYHVLALKNDGTVWAWGDNVSGQIGDGTTIDRTSPVQVSGLTGVKTIAAGRFFSLAVKSDGTVWTWGENLYGQLGDGTAADKSTPIQVSGLTGITDAVAATGAFHCMALKNDNTIWSWGRNTYGNIGDGTTTNRSTPVQVSGVTAAAGLAAGTNFTLLYKNDGTFWGCGRNSSGQLGDGTVNQRNTFTQANGACSVLQTVGIAKLKNTEVLQIKTFPNPSPNGKFFIEIVDDVKQMYNCKLEIYNAVGQLIIQSNAVALLAEGRLRIDLSAQELGIYYLNLRTENYSVNQKLIRN